MRYEIYDDGYFNTLDFRAYFRRFRAIILAADAAGADDPEYRGLTVGEINRRIGSCVNKQWTADCLQMASLFRAGLVPERYSFRRPDTVRRIPAEKWDSIPRPEFRRELGPHEIPMHQTRSRRHTF